MQDLCSFDMWLCSAACLEMQCMRMESEFEPKSYMNSYWQCQNMVNIWWCMRLQHTVRSATYPWFMAVYTIASRTSSVCVCVSVPVILQISEQVRRIQNVYYSRVNYDRFANQTIPTMHFYEPQDGNKWTESLQSIFIEDKVCTLIIECRLLYEFFTEPPEC